MTDEVLATAKMAGAMIVDASEKVGASEIQKVETDVSAAAQKAAEAVDRAVSSWVAGHVHNSPISRDVDAYNHLIGALPRLIEALKALI